jgi:hypothetical protein
LDACVKQFYTDFDVGLDPLADKGKIDSVEEDEAVVKPSKKKRAYDSIGTPSRKRHKGDT